MLPAVQGKHSMERQTQFCRRMQLCCRQAGAGRTAARVRQGAMSQQRSADTSKTV